MNKTKKTWTISSLSDNTRTVIERDGEIILATIGGTRRVTARQIVKTANCHDDLLEACRQAKQYLRRIIPKTPDDGENRRKALDILYSAIAIAKAEEKP